MCFTISVALVALPYSIVLHTSLARVQGFSLTLTTHNSTALRENGMTEDILIYTSLEVKKCFVSGHQTQKGPVYPYNFSVSFFSSPDIHQSQYLGGFQTMGKSSFLICAFWTFRFLHPSYHSKNISLSSQ